MLMVKAASNIMVNCPCCPRCLLFVHDCNSNLSPAHSFLLPVFLLFNGHSNALSRRVYALGRGREVLRSQFEQGASSHTTYRDLATLPSEASQRAQPRASTSAAPPRAPIAQAGKQASRTEHAIGQRATQAQPSVQEEGSGYLSTESDSDTGTNKKIQVGWWQILGVACCCLTSNLLHLVASYSHVLQRKAASSGAQTTRECKGHSRQIITMAFLEEGGYFDVPIQVKVTPGLFPAATAWHIMVLLLPTQDLPVLTQEIVLWSAGC